jgi:hypothetical protein
LRQLQLSRRFFLSKRYHAPAGTPEGRAVARVLAQLEDERLPLPGPEDLQTNIPPVLQCLARPIPSAGLLVCYRLVGDQVHVLAVKPAS